MGGLLREGSRRPVRARQTIIRRAWPLSKSPLTERLACIPLREAVGRLHNQETSMANPVVHFEFLSRDPEGISGGIFKPPQPEPWPAQTTMYVLVDDLAAYRKRITDAGGKITIEEMKVGEMGSLTLFADPEGRMMGLWRAAQAG
jgi:predicted enzyme related to lactoylglutathione lyase